ncbi:MAG: BCCT family transporter [Pseudomonadota bacterium]
MKQNVDRINFSATLLVILLVSVPLIFAPEAGAKVLEQAYEFIATQFGFLYLLAGCAALILLLWLAFGRFGKVKLGDEADTPEFSTFSWIGMLFCAGVGAGLMYWASIEWAFYYEAPPFGVEPESVLAARWATAYGLFHWGPTAWAFYCLPTLAIAYAFYVKKASTLKFSTSCHYFLGDREDHPGARLIDFLFMIALVGGAGSSLGFTTPLIATFISHLTGIEASFGLEVFVVCLCVALFAVSVYLGLERGIKRLSDLNMWLAFALLAFILIAGPTLFLIKTAVTAVGTVAQNFIQISTWADPFTDSGFVEEWTVFYWAWWVAYGPFVGLFVTRISRGRTIKEVVLGMLVYGSMGGALFYLVLGNFSFYQQMSGQLDVLAIMSEQGSYQAILMGLAQLPIAEIVIALFCFVSIIFAATTYDSASYILASSATLKLRPSEDPPRWHRAFWSFALAVLPITLMYIGGLRVAQTAVLVVSLPILLVGILMSVSLLKSLGEDHARADT